MLPLTLLLALAPQPLLPAVEAEDTIYTYEPANNGSGPLWGYGTTNLVRLGDTVFASGIETLKDVKPLNNVRWTLHRRGAKGWEQVAADPEGRQRENCPLVGTRNGRLYLASNPTLTAKDTYNGPAQPTIFEFSAADPRKPVSSLNPPFVEHPPFTEHSYKGFGGDGATGELLLLNIFNHVAHWWTYRDAQGKWSHQGRLDFPMGDYEVPEPIRLCYPEVVIHNKAAHVLAISDIIEPVKAWREYRKEATKQNWDYDFRRLFYAWTPDITTTPFSAWTEVASMEKTCGWVNNLDLWLDAQGRAHVLWVARNIKDALMRDKFFPGTKLTSTLDYGIVDHGKLVQHCVLASSTEGDASSATPQYGRFQATPDGRLFVFYSCSGGGRPYENRLVEVFGDGTKGESVPVPLQQPFTSFMTASERGGSAPSGTLDVYGARVDAPGIGYARINLLNRLAADFTATIERTERGAKVTLDASASRSLDGTISAWRWDVGGQRHEGKTVTVDVPRSGGLPVSLTVRDSRGEERTSHRTLDLPLGPGDFGLTQWRTIVRTEAENFAAEGGGSIHVRNDKFHASALSLSHWNTQGHWLEWPVNLPVADQWYLVARYATPEAATRTVTIDGKVVGQLRVPESGGYGGEGTDNWRLAALTDAAGKRLALTLSAGAHTVRLTNADGTGLNLDYLDWVGLAAPAPTAAPAGLRYESDGGYRYLLPTEGVLATSLMNPEIGFCYIAPLGPHYPGDGIKDSPESKLKLYEDGKELGPAHSPHVDIRNTGNGRYSHWTTVVYFSTSDHSDPRTNGRKYTWRIEP